MHHQVLNGATVGGDGGEGAIGSFQDMIEVNLITFPKQQDSDLKKRGVKDDPFPDATQSLTWPLAGALSSNCSRLCLTKSSRCEFLCEAALLEGSGTRLVLIGPPLRDKTSFKVAPDSTLHSAKDALSGNSSPFGHEEGQKCKIASNWLTQIALTQVEKMHLMLWNAFQSLESHLDTCNGLLIGQPHLKDGSDQCLNADLDDLVQVLQVKLTLSHAGEEARPKVNQVHDVLYSSSWWHC